VYRLQNARRNQGKTGTRLISSALTTSALACYRGRFAPSPTGPLHAGSLYAAIASYLDAKANKGRWLVRIEDLDPPREQPGADQLILECLARHGLEADEPVVYQSTRLPAYSTALASLLSSGHAYWCTCSRVDFARHGGSHAPDCPRSATKPRSRAAAVRARFSSRLGYEFTDRIQSTQAFLFERPADDFVLLRKDGLFSYQLAVTVDDADQRITDVVRGTDLIDSTVRQMWLQRALGYATPRYAHVPVVVDQHGNKLSKQRFADPVDLQYPLRNLLQCFAWLNLGIPPAADTKSPQRLLHWATLRWQTTLISSSNIRFCT